MFSEIPRSEWLASNRSAFAVADKFPVSPGHSLVIPRREIATWWEAADDERLDLLRLIDELKALLDRLHRPDGYNVGFNSGAAAGQTVGHFHIHVIPRFNGDVDDPCGGVRHVIPGKGNYLASAAQDLPQSSVHPPAADVSAYRLVDGREGRVMRLELVRAMSDPTFDQIDLVVSFIMSSGLRLISKRLQAAVERGAAARILTSDYLRVTDPDALAVLLDLVESSQLGPGSLGVRVFSDPLVSFHPKAYLFSSTTSNDARGFVGSSNLSLSGIESGIEWNLHTAEVGPLRAGFDAIWHDSRSVELSHGWLREYRRRWARPATAAEAADTPAAPVEAEAAAVENEPVTEPPEPRQIQAEALEALAASRKEGFGAGLVVMATGLGKTWLAAFDSARPEFGRVLFVAHREEILRQSRDVFRAVRPEAELGIFQGGVRQPDADVVFASVQTLARRLDEFDPAEFDYVVVDEFHHAAAGSYRRVIDYFRPAFLLGLTATPDRMDGADLLALCGDNVVFECGLVEGIDRAELVPFRYWGIKDVADYQGIPWRSGRFDPAVLADRIETQQRAQQAFDEWSERCGERALGFCASVGHADFMARFFRDRGVDVLSVHSGPSADDRVDAVEALRGGRVRVVFTVDVFNEGVDLPEVDSVLMLRPTESPVVFLQQLGRGLRLSEGKDHLRVVDFVGNHRSFLHRPRTLLGLTRQAVASDREVLEKAESGEWDLPEGCSIVYDLEALDLLRVLAAQRSSVGDALEAFCRDHVEEHGFRPTAMQTYRSGYNPDAARKRSGSWFGLLSALGLLDEMEQAAVDAAGPVLHGLESERITKSYKLVTLRALLGEGCLRTGGDIAAIARRAQRLVSADPRLVADCRSRSLPDPVNASEAEWEAMWRRWPLEHMIGRESSLFRVEGDRFEPAFSVPEAVGDAFDALAAELVEWRLADYLLHARSEAGKARCKVIHSSGNPIVMLDRKRHPDLPVGEEQFRADGSWFVGRWMKVALNVATAAAGGPEANALPELLRGWFGPDAGHPGTRHAVLVEHEEDGWSMRPERVEVGNPLAGVVGQRIKRQQVPALFGLEYNPGNWNSGHVSLPNDVVLFVTLTKSANMDYGADYVDEFESADVFAWTSQNSTTPTSAKGREILSAEESGTRIHLFTRERKTDVAFEYRGTLLPLSHEGSAPMRVRFKLSI